ncbi:MAG: hypothetical protein ACI9S8_002354 [Chlamydiales bacterium]|jgi:hypothetical protein
MPLPNPVPKFLPLLSAPSNLSSCARKSLMDWASLDVFSIFVRFSKSAFLKLVIILPATAWEGFVRF